FTLKLLVAAAKFAQPFQSNPAKLTARPRERVGYIGDGNGVFASEFFIGNVRVARQIIVFKETERTLAFAFDTDLVQVFYRERKQAAHPFFLEKFFKRFGRRNGSGIDGGPGELVLGGLKIEGNVRSVAAAFLTA